MRAEKLLVDKQGRIVIPESLLQQLGIEPDSTLVARVENNRLIMETKEQLWQSIHVACANIPETADLAQELIDERRAGS